LAGGRGAAGAGRPGRFRQHRPGPCGAQNYEEFDDEYLDVDYRMDRFLPFLANALA
jgi:hypothetical protein